MRWWILAGCLLFVGAACDAELKVTGIPDVITLSGPTCHTPMPVFNVDSASAADSVETPCPYAYIDVDGDTIPVAPGG